MDVRCEKCQTEYELDEARLKPGGVTVKCTNCGHMFKIRKRTPTNVGAPSVNEEKTRQVVVEERTKPTARAPQPRADSVLDIPRVTGDPGSGPTEQRQWLIRLENGEQKSCRELAVLQGWIVAGVVTRESLISRTGKTWKRLGDVAELGQYFVIADEARHTREARPTGKAAGPAGTMLGVGTNTVRAAGGTILPDDDDAEKPTSHYGGRRPITTPPPPPPARSGQRTPNPSGGKAPPTPAIGVRPVGTAATEVMPPAPPTVPARRPITQPPPVPASNRKTMLHANQAFPQAASNRSTGGWAAEGMPPGSPEDGDGPSFGGRLSAIPDEPAFAGGFAGRVRSGPTDERGFETGKVALVDDDDDLLPGRRGSSAGKWIVIVALLVMGAAAGVIYMVINKQGGRKEEVVKAPADAMQVAVVVDAPTTVTPIVDAAAPQDPLDVARAELGRDDEGRLKTAMTSLDGKDDPAAQSLHARLGVGLAQAMLDRANLLADKSEAEKLRKDAKQLVIDAAPFAQRALKAKADDASANLAMADVLRLQGKSAREIKRYLDAARAKADKDVARDVALSEALVLARDGKLDDAKAALTAIDSGEGKLEQSGDVRARFHLALVALAQGKAGDAKPLVAQILAAAPDHPGARALASRVETAVARTDPLPPEDGAKDAGVTVQPEHHHDTPIPSGASYDALITQGNNAAANTNCTRAMELYAKALEAKPNGVEALAGMGYCHIDRKEFASAHSKFRAALAISPRFEPALFGVAEAYAQQGRKEDAINSFKAYLEVYPGAAKAKRQLEMLGVNLDAPSNPGSAAPPTPQGSGAPPASGSGSDSG